MALIYIVEDDVNIREIESIALKNSGYEVYTFENSEGFFSKIEERIPDLAILDLMLPGESGLDIMLRLKRRPAAQKLPIMIVTAKTSEADMIRGLEDGADDYIKKPFSIMELITRVKVLLRRSTPSGEKYLQSGSIVMNLERHTVTNEDEAVELTYKEFELLKLLLKNQGMVVTREIIMQQVWETDFEGESRTLDMHIKTLRQKLGDAGKKIRTVRNVGYVIDEQKD